MRASARYKAFETRLSLSRLVIVVNHFAIQPHRNNAQNQRDPISPFVSRIMAVAMHAGEDSPTLSSVAAGTLSDQILGIECLCKATLQARQRFASS